MITDFLQTKRSREELKTTLEIIREFKAHESNEEYLAIPIAAWAKLEQLEEFLAHLVEGKRLQPDTLSYISKGGGGR